MADSQWREEASFPSLGRAGHASCCVFGDQLLVCGGRIGNRLYSDVWQVGAVVLWSALVVADGASSNA